MAGRRTSKLADYRRKRRFEHTPEPAATSRRSSRNAAPGSRKFVVHLHHARNRHFDLRLQVGRVLKSWAVPKGPSRDPSMKRLAVEVEDHPLSYAGFEGTIPAGHYGAGEVAIWDAGTWRSADPIEPQLAKGHLRFELDGARLRGEWSLIRTQRKAKQPQWLLIKSTDDYVEADDVADDTPLSAWAANDPVAAPRRQRATGATRTRKPPATADFELQLARLHRAAPAGDAWLHEVKYDGYRMLAWRNGKQLQLSSRNRLDWTARLPQVASAVAALRCRNCVLDGELVVFDKTGHSRFDLLQHEFNRNASNLLHYVVFDVLWLDGKDLRDTPQHARKAVLRALLDGTDATLTYSDHLRGHGTTAYRQACESGLEGIISKAADAPYRGGRTDDWRKLKCIDSDEFAIVGYTTGKGSRGAVGALLLATPDGDGWRYVGRVGTGMDAAMLQRLHALLQATSAMPDLQARPTTRQLRGARPVWVRPTQVIEVAFRGRTSDGLLRQASFKGLRPDKSTGDLRRSERNPGATKMSRAPAKSAKTEVAFTHPDRVLIAQPETTKRDLADFYAGIAARLLPGIVNRPLSLLRCPDGADSDCFFQKHPMEGMPDSVHVGDARGMRGKRNQYVFVDDIEGVLGLVQMNVIEFHPWGSTISDLEHPDRLVFDLDPDPQVAWPRVKSAAALLRERLHAVGLESFLRTTGGKGLHLVVPLNPRPDWEDAKAFAHALARTLEQAAPDEFISAATKNRRTDRIFIDYLRNARGATAVASYSVRARPGAPIATPLRWDELPRLRSAAQYTLANIGRRLQALKQDPWHGFEACRQSLPQK